MNKLISDFYYFLKIQEVYSRFFKGGVLLLVGFAAGLSVLGSVIWDKDLSAQTLKYQVEEKLGAPFTLQTNCLDRPAVKTDCEVAKYQLRAVADAFNVFTKYMYFCFFCGFPSFLLGCIGLFGRYFPSRRANDGG